MNEMDTFMEKMCGKIKYRTVHNDIVSEVKSHIAELAEDYERDGYDKEQAERAAISNIGNAEEIGNAFNKNYQLPFNCRYGLTIWAGLVTIICYIFYPVIVKLNNFTLKVYKIQYNSISILLVLLLFAAVNLAYLKRGQLKLTFRDGISIFMGFLIGWCLAVAGLMIASNWKQTGFYPYFPDVKIPFASPYIPMALKSLDVFGMEFFSCWFCLFIYMLSVKGNNKTNKFVFLPRYMAVHGYVEIDDDFYDGKKSDNTR